MGKLDGKVAIVTGASKGIGEGIARVFARHGAKVVLAARGEGAMALAQELRDAGFDALGVRCDVSSYEDCQRLAQAALDAYGRIDVLDCNAGICVLGDFLSEDDSWRDSHIDINVKGVLNGCQAASRVLGEGGVIINTSSMVSKMGQPSGVAYPMSKFAVNGITVSLARELGPRGIRVNAVAPGVTATDMVASLPEEMIAPIAAAIPLKRVGQPEDVANAFVYLASDLASYVTGEVLAVDGGMTV